MFMSHIASFAMSGLCLTDAGAVNIDVKSVHMFNTELHFDSGICMSAWIPTGFPDSFHYVTKYVTDVCYHWKIINFGLVKSHHPVADYFPITEIRISCL